jgi:hypothetical protein
LFVANAVAGPTTAPSVKEPALNIKELENSGLNHQATNTAPSPIVVKWHMNKVNGDANLIVNSDGSYLFSGHLKNKEKDKDFDISLVLKSSLGGAIVFHYVGDASSGLEWSKQGESEILKDNFKSFAGKVDWAAEYRLHLDKEGMAKLYKEKEEKKEKMKQEELEKERKKEAQEAQQEAAQQQKQQSSGGGSSALSTVGSVLSTVGEIAGIIALF